MSGYCEKRAIGGSYRLNVVSFGLGLVNFTVVYVLCAGHKRVVYHCTPTYTGDGCPKRNVNGALPEHFSLDIIYTEQSLCVFSVV